MSAQHLDKPRDILPHRPPFLLLDAVVDCHERSARAVRTFRREEDFFAGHFPGNPVVPGVLLLEGMAQTFAYVVLRNQREADVYLTGVDKARFRKPVLPEQTVEFVVEIDQLRLGVIFGSAEAWVGEQRVANARLSGIVTRSA